MPLGQWFQTGHTLICCMNEHAASAQKETITNHTLENEKSC